MPGRSSERNEEPRGLAATSVERPAGAARAPIDPRHQQALQKMRQARLVARAGRNEEARALRREAFELERDAARASTSPETKALLAETATRAALEMGEYRNAWTLAGEVLPQIPGEDCFFLARLRSLSLALDHLSAYFPLEPDWRSLDESHEADLLVRSDSRLLEMSVVPEADEVTATWRGADRVNLSLPLEPARYNLLSAITSTRERSVVRERSLTEDFVAIPAFAA